MMRNISVVTNTRKYIVFGPLNETVLFPNHSGAIASLNIIWLTPVSCGSTSPCHDRFLSPAELDVDNSKRCIKECAGSLTSNSAEISWRVVQSRPCSAEFALKRPSRCGLLEQDMELSLSAVEAMSLGR